METRLDVLFEPFRLGSVSLRNRIVLSPLTRQRSHLSGMPTDMNVEYYRQRASAGLIITEGTSPSAMGMGYLFEPGLFTEAHVAGWRRVTDAVHAEGGAIFCQLMHTGRLSDPLQLPDGRIALAPSAVRPDPTLTYSGTPRANRPYPLPKAMTLREIYDTIDEFRKATELAVRAGFDGVEVHAATGYLPIQFLSTNSNLRDDEFGGSVERRANFLLSCVDAMSTVKGASYVAVKILPGSTAQGVFDDEPEKMYPYLVSQLSKRGIGYLHLPQGAEGNTWDGYATLRPLFDGPMIAARGFSRPTAATKIAAGEAEMVAFGQLLLANPDLVARFRNDWPLNRPNAATYYSQGEEGYTDYPFYPEGDPETMLPPDSAAPVRVRTPSPAPAAAR